MTEYNSEQSGNEWLYREYINRENQFFHAPYEREMEFYTSVKTGDINRVRAFLNSSFTSTPGLGSLSSNPLRNFKYHFIITAAMVSRSCIDAGLPLEQAYSLSDFYIQKADKASTLDEIDRLHDDMVTAYTVLMKKLRADAFHSKPVTMCLNYIYSHLHTRITLKTLSMHVSLSPSYLSKLFKSEMHMTVSEYIEHQKIETASNMLKYSEYSPGEISSILGFPSQSYFTERFRLITGETPAKFRTSHFAQNSFY